MAVVDTNVLVRLITGDSVELSDRAQQLVEAAEPRSLLVDRVVLAETLYVLRSNYLLPKPVALELLTDVLLQTAFGFIDTNTCTTMLDILRQTNLSPEDACLAAMVKTGQADGVRTFDKALEKYVATLKG